MQNKIELNDIELEKVTGGVNENDISDVKELISQLINVLSSINEPSEAFLAINYFNDTIKYLDQNRLDNAKKSFEDGISYVNSLSFAFGDIFAANNFSDTITGIRVTMNW